MSRLYDFLQKANTAPGMEDSNPASSEVRQVLAVLNMPTPPPGDTQPEVPKSVEVEQVQIRPAARLVVHTDPGGPTADRFRLLRVRLRELARAGSLRTLLVTSPLPQDGKSTVALNLATALAEGGARRVVLIDADLHASTLERQLGLQGHPGLTECLRDGRNPIDAVRRVEPLGFFLLHHGQAPGNPSELLQTAPFSALLQSLSSRFDWILIDTPPVLALTDALSMSRHVDASLVVARAGRTPREAVDEAVMLLGRKQVMGVLLNGVEHLQKGYSNYDRYYARKKSAGRPPAEYGDREPG